MKHQVNIAITAASYSGNKGAAAMLQSSIGQLKQTYGDRLHISLMSVYPKEDRKQCPHPCVTIVPAQPQRLLFLAFPCAVVYRMCGWCPPLRTALLKNKILKAYKNTDLVIDEAGIAFSDSRSWVLNTYAFVCAAVPMLMGVPVVKYSQALGPFHNRYNRFLAAWILPKMKLIAARGRDTYAHLHAIGIHSNVKLYADGAFTMPPAPQTEAAVQKQFRRVLQKWKGGHIAALSISSVVERRCQKEGVDYCQVMAEFIAYLVKRGYLVYMFANAARIHSKKPRNNDLMTGDQIMRLYQKLSGSQEQRLRKQTGDLDGAHGLHGARRERRFFEKDGSWQEWNFFENGLIWEHREMDAEEIRACIGQCELLIASRFHAMVFALSGQVPVMLIGWSHKYQEVMEQFALSEYAQDYSMLSLESLKQRFEIFLEHQEEIRGKISQHLPAVQKSSGKNIRHIVKILDTIQKEAKQKGFKQKELKQKGLKQKELKQKEFKQKELKQKEPEHKTHLNHVIDLTQPERYTGSYLQCLMGYASDAHIRKNAASGGMVTALLCSLLKNHEIDGAWVVKTAFTKQGELTYETAVATCEQEICEASSSVYMTIPMLSHLEQLRAFDGRLAVVLTPCMMRAFCRILEKDECLREKIVLKIGLFCSGAHDKKATEYALDKCHIDRSGAKRLYYRRGHWRGTSSVVYQDGTERQFSYTKSICAYKNAFFFTQRSCLHCKDQFAQCADISFGDVWLAQMKKEDKKYTGCIIRTKQALQMIERAKTQGDLHIRAMTPAQTLRSQSRALTFKYRGKRWNHRLAGCLAEKNRTFSVRHPQLLKKIPLPAVYGYMCFIRLLLSF